MLYIYGPYLPIRVLEEIRFWKQQEREHTAVIKGVVPAIEPSYAILLDEWAKVFGETGKAADSLLQHALSSEAQVRSDTELSRQTERLLAASLRQSQEWIRQLGAISQQSRAAAESPLTFAPLQEIVRESEYFLTVLGPLGQPGQIAQAASQAYYPVSSDGLGSRLEGGEQQLFQANQDMQQRLSKDGSVAGAVPIGGHKLPPLPYPYNALEPYIDETTMRIHHDKHHLAYVEDLNKAEKKLEEARASGNFDLVKHWERELAFNGAGHYLHTLFWDTMNPKGGGKPEGALAEQIKQDFGSFDAFQKQFSAAAEKVEGGGWAILVWSPRAHRLEILQAEKHQNLSQWDIVPLLPLDVWEHAYYLKHQNDRKAYIKDWWNVVYWPAVQERYLKARQLQWQPF